MKNIFLLLFLSIFFVNVTDAQVTISLPDTTLNSSGAISIPVTVNGFTGIAGFNCVIKFNPNVLICQNVQTQSKNISYNILNGEVRIIYADINNPININNGVLLNLNFIYTGDSTQINLSNVAIGNSEAQQVSFTTYDGNISGVLHSDANVTLGGTVWYDANNNGIKDKNEPGVRWVTVDIFSGNGFWLTYTLTDSLGQYSVDTLSPGSYFTRFDLAGTNKKYKFIDSSKDSPLHGFTDTTAYSNTIYLTGGSKMMNNNAGLALKNPTGISDQNSDHSIPGGLMLSQNYPNPFNPSTTIEFQLPKEEKVTLQIYNVLGQLVKTLFDSEASAGIHRITFDASNLSSGIYFYRLSGNNINVLKKMIFSK